MDNHPIPQDVTGFQFKLLGNMTVKQFAYLATGVVFAWILLQLPISILIKFPFAAFSALFGAGLAFFPISGRPMDLMIGNYIKALIRPTQFVYEKVGGQIYFPNKTFMPTTSVKQYRNDFSPFPKDKLKAYLESLDAQPKNKVDEKENNFLLSVSNLAAGNIPQVSLQPKPTSYGDLPNPLTQEAVVLPEPIVTTDNPASTPSAPTKPAVPPEQVKTAVHPAVITQTPTPTAPPVKQTEQAKIAMPALKGFNKAIGLPSAPDSPNLITGITRDARGNALSNILIEIRDKDGNPVRAFKTNELGRFASATPLTSGTYTIEFEDPKAQNKFEKMTINVTGQIILPIEAISVDTREELRRSLFNIN